MDTMLSNIFKSPASIIEALGTRAKAARLALGWTRKTLSVRSDVPEPTIKRFEQTGNIGTAALISIAVALDGVNEIELLFAPKPIHSIGDVTARKRTRGSK